ncbi:hypothetical protein, partial [Mesorhizobium sp. M7A.F.Ca.ET.027.02.1.1]|uniref:hypothetical protein n=1 Tax=Mesorhizobium sp. M7A.F.Ca.ET.027.02.1.1 TaxID=2496655 RepID=UPI001AECB422
TGNWFAAAPRQPNRLALPRTHHKGENCYLSIRFKLLPIYRLDSSRALGTYLVALKIGEAPMTASFSPSLYGEKCPAGQ